MNNTDIRSLYGLKYNPFLPDVPAQALFAIPGTERFAQRVQTMAAHGGFALITGEPGAWAKAKLCNTSPIDSNKIPDLTVGVMQRPQSALGDFYRELGELFDVAYRRPIATAASRPCAPAGKPTANPHCFDPCCSSTRPNRSLPSA